LASAAGGLDFRDHLIGGRMGPALTAHRTAQIVDDDPGTPRGKHQCMRLAQAIARAGHQRNAAIKSNRHR
jgi:hypothetical protein